jgi:hypothetical protein
MVNPPAQCAGDVQEAATPLVLLAKDTTTAAPSFSLGRAVIGFQSGNGNPNATPRVTVTLTDPQGKPEFVKQVYRTYTWICMALQRPEVPAAITRHANGSSGRNRNVQAESDGL